MSSNNDNATEDKVNVKTVINLSLSNKAKEILKDIAVDDKTNSVRVTLNHESKKTIVSSIYPDWIKTISTFQKQAERKGLPSKDIDVILDELDDNYETILERILNNHKEYDPKQIKTKDAYIRKYSGNGNQIPLSESIIIGTHPKLLAASTILSYYQDKFGTTHYIIIVGDNGSGKNSALLVYRLLGYRVFYVTAASAANYYTFLGDIEEGQGTLAEDEADNIHLQPDKYKVCKTGYASGGSVPKVDIHNNTGRRSQGVYLTFCMKWFAMEELPDYKEIKGFLDRSYVLKFVVGSPQYNIKGIIKNGADPKFKPLYEELLEVRKLLLMHRMYTTTT